MITERRGRQIGPTLFRFEYASDIEDATFYIFLNGEFAAETRETFFEVTVLQGEQVQFDVFDDPDEAPSAYFPSIFILRWDGEPDTVMYRVEQYLDGAWAVQDVVTADDTRVFHYPTGTLADSTVHQFRIVPIDAEGRTGEPLELEAEMCRYPDAPDFALAGAGGEITIT